ncbi:hypothetical protein DPMN_041559 [Dreissena polymorpha]|nr:hypothetical protein DPMN_041559 [Dreissena polymorpha]
MLPIVSMLCLVALTSATLPFKITDCSTSPNKIVRIENVHLSQDPVKIPGNETVTADVTILQSIAGTGHYNVSLRIQRHVFNGWVEAPCIHDFGSCSYDLCTVLSGKHYQNTTHHCPIEIAETSPDFECACPFPVGTYHLNPTTAHIDNLASYLKWLAQGDYKVEAKILDTTTHAEVGCFIVQATTASDCTGIQCIFGKRHEK